MNWICRTLLTAGAIALALSSLLPPAQTGWTQDFSGTGRSGKRVGGASRGDCPNTLKPLTPLIPKSAENGGWTVQSHPTFWVYIPYPLTPEKSVKFTLQDDQGKNLYQAKLTKLESNPGLVSIPLSTDKAPSLEVGKSYQWFFEVQCDEVSDRPAYVSSWITRVAVAPALAQQLQRVSPQQQSTLYANHKLWYDALTTLGEALRSQPDDKQLKTRWRTLLRLPSVGLEPLISEPLAPELFNVR